MVLPIHPNEYPVITGQVLSAEAGGEGEGRVVIKEVEKG